MFKTAPARIYPVSALFCIILITTAGVYWFRIGYNSLSVREGLFIGTILIAVIAGIYGINKSGPGNPRKPSLYCYTGALALLGIGNFLLFYLRLFLPDSLVSSSGDILILFTYPLFLTGITREFIPVFTKMNRTNKMSLLLTIGFILFLFIISIYSGVYRFADSKADLFENMILASYGITDLIMMIAVLMLAVMIFGNISGGYVGVWLIMLLSFIFFILADILWAFYPQEYINEIWPQRSIMDTLWIFGHMGFALSFLGSAEQ